ncbi:MAG TPA: ATP-binding protein [Polyangiaceae bacterium]|nr:ATP-binding protein [Polyangiaceae bacterium]
MPAVHLITGNVGAGKTTYAMELADRLGGVRFSTDEWMVTLFHADMKDVMDLPWTLERIDRLERQVWKVVAQLASRGIDAVLDLGLSKKAHREKHRALARALGIDAKLHFLDVDLATRALRVKKRNAEKRESFAFEVTDAMIEFMEGYFERPDGDELAGAVVVGGSPGGAKGT